MIPFNLPTQTGTEQSHIARAIASGQLAGNGPYTKKCEAWFNARLGGVSQTLLTSSCTHALEMAAMLLGVGEGDEVIMPSFTFPGTANAFVLRGARIVFVDVEPRTMNMDANQVAGAITSRTKAIVAVHYAGVACDMDALMALADQHGIYVVEDAAQAMLASYKKKPLGAFGHVGAYSFHATKNFTSGGEGGLLIVNDPSLQERAYYLRESGTNRNAFLAGKVDKYSWVDQGSSYLLSELGAAYLWGGLEQADSIHKQRLTLWEQYTRLLAPLAEQGALELPFVPEHCEHNAHLFSIKLKNQVQRQALQTHLQTHGIETATHYVPLHSSVAGQRYGRFHGDDEHTTLESQRLLRLPMFYGLSAEQVGRVCEAVALFFAL